MNTMSIHFPKQEIKKDGKIFDSETSLSNAQKEFHPKPVTHKNYDNKGQKVKDGKLS